ncbi:MAG: hypothetical protein R2822_13315 [Spirosomataceae bacterium]
MIAEELELRPDQYEIRQTGGEAKFGRGQSVGGSGSIRGTYENTRKLVLPLVKCSSKQPAKNGKFRLKIATPKRVKSI